MAVVSTVRIVDRNDPRGCGWSAQLGLLLVGLPSLIGGFMDTTGFETVYVEQSKLCANGTSQQDNYLVCMLQFAAGALLANLGSLVGRF